jgi:SAM-dependent methyltransferase
VVITPFRAVRDDRTARKKSDDYVPFAVRFRAWWDGVEPGALVKDGQAGGIRRNKLIVVDSPELRGDGPETRAELKYRLWSRLYGEGFSFPGGQEGTTALLKRIGLKKSGHFLDLAAGIGGATRLAALQFGATVMGLEADPELAEMGMKLSVIRGLEARVPISAYDPAMIELADSSYDVILIRDGFFAMDDRERLLEQMRRALTSDGKIVLNGLIRAPGAAVIADNFAKVSESPRQNTIPWTLAEFDMECLAAGLRVSLFMDLTESHRKLLLDGWNDFSSTLTRGSLDRPFVDILMGEAEIVKNRIAAINAGTLRFCHVELTRSAAADS